MTEVRAVLDEPAGSSTCWCCGARTDPTELIGLGSHPEVSVCVRCARWLGKRAREVEDRTRSGPTVQARNLLRQLRGAVVHRGWQDRRLIGRPLRWLGRHLP